MEEDPSDLQSFNIYDYFRYFGDLISEYPQIIWIFFASFLLLWFTGYLSILKDKFLRWNSERVFKAQHENILPNYGDGITQRLRQERLLYVERLEKEAKERAALLAAAEEKLPKKKKPIEDAEYILNKPEEIPWQSLRDASDDNNSGGGSQRYRPTKRKQRGG